MTRSTECPLPMNPAFRRELRAALEACGFGPSTEDIALTERWVCDEYGPLATSADLRPTDASGSLVMTRMLTELKARWRVLHTFAMDQLFHHGIYDTTSACRAAAVSTLAQRVEAAIKVVEPSPSA